MLVLEPLGMVQEGVMEVGMAVWETTVAVEALHPPHGQVELVAPVSLLLE
jgi:hypothetical protein